MKGVAKWCPLKVKPLAMVDLISILIRYLPPLIADPGALNYFKEFGAFHLKL